MTFALSIETIVNPVRLDEANCEGLVDFDVDAAPGHGSETVRGTRSHSRQRGAGVRSSEQRVDERVDFTAGIQRDYRAAGVTVNLSLLNSYI